MSGKTVLVSVERDNKYTSNERLVSRFIKMCKKERIREEFREKMYYRSPGEKRRDKRARAARRRASDERKAQRQRDKDALSGRKNLR